MKTFKNIGELIGSLFDSLNIKNESQYRFDLVNDKLIVTPTNEQSRFHIDLSYKKMVDGSISIDNLKFREFKNNLK